MKVDKGNPLHWLWLSLFSINTLLSLLIRPFVKSPTKVVLYGHKLNGNLKAIYQESENHKDLNPYYLSMDYRNYKELKNDGVRVIWGGSIKAISVLANTKIIVSDHGLHCLIILLKCTGIKFVDVWHGIPFKGFDKNDFKLQRQYDEVWVTSPYLAKLYEEKFGFQKEKLKIIGYARTDKLVRKNDQGLDALRDQLGLQSNKRPVVIFAPTWAQDENNRSIYPFGCSEKEFYKLLDAIALECDCIFLIRKHVNSNGTLYKESARIIDAASDKYADTEQLLLLSDVLIYDWSSIAFDYLLLNRPAIYLDVLPPFKNGFTLDGSYRYGLVASSLNELEDAVAGAVDYYESLAGCISDSRENTLKSVYGKYADGNASKRGCFRLIGMLGTK